MPQTEAPKHKLIPVYIMGQKHMVPEGSTIMGALEYVGYQLKRGVGCREGFCGACATVYRVEGDYKLRGGLACQTVVTDGMSIAQIRLFTTSMNSSLIYLFSRDTTLSYSAVLPVTPAPRYVLRRLR